jgi:hypothetical protein
MGFTSLENQFISASFGQLVQISGSALGDGNGAELSSSILEITASHAIQSNSAISASHALSADSVDSATSSSHAVNADSAISASHALVADTLLGSVVSASHADNADTAISASHALIADHSTTTQEVIINVKNTSGAPIAKGTPVYATGVTGENINVSPADYSSPTTMPAIAVTQVALNTNATGEATVTGRIIGVNTTGFTAGRNIYVNGGGTFQDTRPTGSGVLVQNIGVVGKVDAVDGEIVIQGSGRANDLPNITDGMLWVGNSDGVATQVSESSLDVSTAVSASHAVDADSSISSSHAVNADRAISASNADSLKSGIDITIRSGSFDFITAASASVGYLESITGSAKIIGDAFIILNNDLPTERYAGLVVQDSGSGAPLTTASFQFDGQTNDWFYEYSDDGGATVDHGITIFGPQYNTIGNPIYPTANEIQMGNGDHHITGSKLFSDGSKVYADIPFSASAGFTGSLNGQADTAISASHALNADLAITASHALNAAQPQLVAGTGNSSTAQNIAGGASSTAGGFGALALGNSATADNVEAVALGSSATVRSNYGIGIGRLAETETGDSPVAIGNAAVSYGNNSVAIGKEARAESGSNNSVVVGLEARTMHNNSVLIGTNASGSGDNQIIIGSGSQDYGANTTEIGNYSTTDAYINGVLHTDGARISGSISNEIKFINPGATSNTASLDLANYNTFHINMEALPVGSYRIEAASSPVAGAVYNIQIDNGSITSTLSGVDAEFKFPGGTLPTLADSAQAINIMSGLSIDGTSVMMTALADFQ